MRRAHAECGNTKAPDGKKAANVAEACQDVTGLVKKMLKCEAAVRQMCNILGVIGPWWIFSTYFTVREGQGNTNPEPRAAFGMMEVQQGQVCWCGEMLKSAHWPWLCCSLKSSLPSTRLFIATWLHLPKTLSARVKSVIFSSTHSSSSRFGFCHFHCLHTLAWFTKSSAQRQGHTHLFSCV